MNNNKDTTSINFRNAYVSLDPFLTNEYSKSAGKQINCFRYFFLYNNNIMATIIYPIAHQNELIIFSEKELIDSIRNGFFDNPINSDDINWYYFKISNQKLYYYVINYDGGNGKVFFPVGSMELYYELKDKNIINKHSYQINNEPEVFVNEIYLPSSITVKPDSSKSRFIRAYNKYISTGKTRHYPYYKDFEKYINKK